MTRRMCPPMERFLAKVDIDETTGCWRWTAFKDSDGYGRFGRTGAHRASYEMFVGPIPEGLLIDHVRERGCRHRDCVNPDHLEPVTTQENTRRRPYQGKTWEQFWQDMRARLRDERPFELEGAER